jgi:hypothetical protein
MLMGSILALHCACSSYEYLSYKAKDFRVSFRLMHFFSGAERMAKEICHCRDTGVLKMGKEVKSTTVCLSDISESK